jgi:cell shape-determining protein MreD
MNWLHTILILVAVFLAVLWEAAFPGVRHLLGAQIDLLPAIIVYAGLRAGLLSVGLVAFCGGLLIDSLSANPLGISVLPLFAAGLGVYGCRELVLREQTFAQVVLGLAASGIVPLLTLVLLLTTGQNPMLGWGTIWQLFVMSVGGAIATPVLFVIFESVQRALVHARPSQSSFRADREIRRGR